MKKSQNKSNENKKFTGKKPAKSNFSKSTERPKVQIFIKKFDTFEDAWKELNKIPSAPATLLPAFCENDGNVTAAQNILMNIFKDNISNVEGGSNNMFWSINIAANRSYIKTDQYVGFGWDIEYAVDKDTKQYAIKSVVLNFVSYNQFKTVNEINYVMKHDWKKKD